MNRGGHEFQLEVGLTPIYSQYPFMDLKKSPPQLCVGVKQTVAGKNQLDDHVLCQRQGGHETKDHGQNQ